MRNLFALRLYKFGITAKITTHVPGPSKWESPATVLASGPAPTSPSAPKQLKSDVHL